MKNRSTLNALPQIAIPPAVEKSPVAPFPTVLDAVRTAMTHFGSELTFGPDVEKGVAELHPTAGPPDKVYRSIALLAEMVQERRQGLLRVGMVGWLNEHGVKCSGESDSVRRNFGARRKRTFHDGETRTFFSPHLKVSDGVGPDRCVRVYFDWREARQLAVVGWVGRHPK